MRKVVKICDEVRCDEISMECKDAKIRKEEM
jgi:hypothetical protein